MNVSKTLIIAEAGVNHNGSIESAKMLIDVADNAGADFVKFQTFIAENLVTKNAAKASYQKKSTNSDESHFKMLKNLELDIDDHLELMHYCKKKKVKFLSTAFDYEGIDLLIDLDIPMIKIPSGEITNLPFLEYIGCKGLPTIMSTGMSTMNEVIEASQVILNSGTKKEKLTILHCNTDYPTPAEDVNLNAMLKIKKELGVNIGYSDHTLGIEIPIAAVAMGATVIEKHFTLDRALPGPDHSASLEPNELNAMIKSIRNVEKALGNGMKIPSQSEIKNIPAVRRSIVAKKFIKKGDKFSTKNITTKRPGTGLSPMRWYEVINEKSKKSFDPDDLIEI